MTATRRPLPVIRENLPDDLSNYRQFVAWDIEIRDDKPTKVPKNPRTGRNADVTIRNTWASLDQALAGASEHLLPGIGFVFTADDPFFGIDLDKCRDPETGTIEEWAWQIIHRLNTYTEVSPSGTGVKLLGNGEWRGSRKVIKVPHRIEGYSSFRFFTLTGHHVDGTPSMIQPCQAELDALYLDIYGDDQPKETAPRPTVSLSLSDEDVMQRIQRSKDATKFAYLWSNDNSGYGDDESAADMAFCNLIRFYGGRDPARIDRMYRASARDREKWDRNARSGETYGEGTIKRALDGDVWGESMPRLIVANGDSNRHHDEPIPDADTPIERPPRFRLFTPSGLRLRPAPEWLVEGMLLEDSLAGIVGGPASFKSFLALDLALCVAGGYEWNGHAVRRGAVVYISAEGSKGIPKRIAAWERHHFRPAPENCYFIPDAVQMMDTGDVAELLSIIEPLNPSLVIIDTLARTMLGFEENSSKDMGVYVAGADRIRSVTGANVMLIHHTSKAGDTRGSTALPGALDTRIDVKREDELVIVNNFGVQESLFNASTACRNDVVDWKMELS